MTTRSSNLSGAFRVVIEWYNTDSNKPIIFHVVLGIWTFYLIIMFTILPLEATNINRAAFYVPLVFFIPLTYLLTYLLLNAHSNYHAIINHEISSSYIVNDNVHTHDNSNNNSDHTIVDITTLK